MYLLIEMERNKEKINKAGNFAKIKHAGQTRKDAGKRPYLEHLIRVASLVSKLEFMVDDDTICAAFLHDTLEDTDTSADELTQEFGEKVCDIVQELTDNKKLTRKFRKLHKMRDADLLSFPASLVLWADLTANLEDLAFNPPVDWDYDRKIDYIEWAYATALNIHYVEASLWKDFINAFVRAKNAVNEVPHNEEGSLN